MLLAAQSGNFHEFCLRGSSDLQTRAANIQVWGQTGTPQVPRATIPSRTSQGMSKDPAAQGWLELRKNGIFFGCAADFRAQKAKQAAGMREVARAGWALQFEAGRRCSLLWQWGGFIVFSPQSSGLGPPLAPQSGDRALQAPPAPLPPA